MHSSAHRALSVPPSGRHSRSRLTAVPSMPTALPHSHFSMRYAIQYKPENCLRVPGPGLRSFLAPHPDRSHQGSSISARRGPALNPLRFASRPSVFLWTPYGPRRFKGPFGTPLIVPPFTHESSASRSRPTGSCAFAAAPYCGGSYLTPAKWQMCGGSCSQKPRTRTRTGGAVSPRYAGSAFRVPVSTNASPVRPFQAPRTRLRLEAAFGGLVLAGRKGRASHRHRSGLKIPARPLAAPASPAVGGARPLLHWPASPLKERAGVPALAPLRGLRTNSRPSIHQDLRSQVNSLFTATRIECHLFFHAQLLNEPDHNQVGQLARSSPSATPCARKTNRCAVFNPSGARRVPR